MQYISIARHVTEFLKIGIRVVEWIKVPLNFPGDATIDSYLNKLKAAGRSEWIHDHIKTFH